MRLVRLSLENWRGVAAREVAFADGVTLIEGPNEIGKSTIVEAVRMLFTEKDSSNKRQVKAIQPVGQDVASRVEAEVRAGDYHFVYAKTYNKSKSTELNVLAPTKRQLTGGEAHEAAEQMLAETVDMALWDALLVDQGEKVGLANLQDSAGLAHALDEAAGSVAGVNPAEDTDLYSAAQAEYEKYFTLKTGKPKFAGLEQALDAARRALELAQHALAEVEADVATHERVSGDVRRRNAQLPQLNARVQEHEQAWQNIRALRDKVGAKLQERNDALIIAQAARDTLEQRTTLIAELEASQQDLTSRHDEQAPLRAQTQALKSQILNTQQTVDELKARAKSARDALDLAQSDARHVQNLEQLARETTRTGQLERIAGALQAPLQVVAAIAVDQAALASFRQADNQLAIARAARDAAATSLSVTARQRLALELDGEAIALDPGAVATRSVTSVLELRLPGVADIRIAPSRSTADLEDQAEEAQTQLTRLAARYGVSNLAEAVAAHEQRAGAQKELDQLRDRERQLLQNTDREAIAATVVALRTQCDRYLAAREATPGLPADAAQAADRADQALTQAQTQETALDAAQSALRQLQTEHDTLDADLRIAQQELAGLERALKDKSERLQNGRARHADDALRARATQTEAKAKSLAAEVVALQAGLKAASPDAVETLFSNARDVYERARAELTGAEQQLAVLNDRLEHAQADGRFEALENGERSLEQLEETFESTRRRAAAVDLLWGTLNAHRNAARQAYVQPLKEAIEKLGMIVFGPDFEVTIGDDWSLQSRTLHGKTLAFDDLSVGAREQLGILTRLAAAQIVATQGGVPLIIDDALGFSDPSRLETMGAAIAAAGKHCQIIILTCTPGRFTHVGSASVVRF